MEGMEINELGKNHMWEKKKNCVKNHELCEKKNVEMNHVKKYIWK